MQDMTETLDSISIYSWKKDKQGTYVDETEHYGSDMLDALRYSYELDLRNNKTILVKR